MVPRGVTFARHAAAVLDEEGLLGVAESVRVALEDGARRRALVDARGALVDLHLDDREHAKRGVTGKGLAGVDHSGGLTEAVGGGAIGDGAVVGCAGGLEETKPGEVVHDGDELCR